jgi:hypothetical protein
VRKTKKVLRLRFEVGLGLRQIARSCSIGLGTVHEYLQRAEAAGVTWPARSVSPSMMAQNCFGLLSPAILLFNGSNRFPSPPARITPHRWSKRFDLTRVESVCRDCVLILFLTPSVSIRSAS